MKKSNIFVHIELSKFARELSADSSAMKDSLKAQAGYFNIITSKYFSDMLSTEWEDIAREVKIKGPKTDEQGRVIANAVIHTIDQMSQQQCRRLVERITSLQKKVQKEFD
ncbi:hypothetical protein SAMN04487995_5956 [Dyadobacter koreensis]|uniref:Uncharacterized protein n=1 Tax=Dyadobacter koreensis TaxID=408657 RepID=A0A1H7AV31_9BACT|nr:hypothetical protein [Dyadobacter koreensis]SEJ69148.1 hypothetical protein SAMN04487995_5956 [Dyadobacter koreensis]